LYVLTDDDLAVWVAGLDDLFALVAGRFGRVEPRWRARAYVRGLLAPLAVVYVRQSPRQQVTDHVESMRLQYGLTERAVALGWAASRMMVIDEDLGRSAANAAERPGFARLAAEITMGQVGLVLGLEMSRLARVGRDWHQLIELCSLAGALLADADGVYDPNWYNDRLLLGLKGTMTEALSRIRHKSSYADFAVMPTMRQETAFGRSGRQGGLGIITARPGTPACRLTAGSVRV
jgi:hypothetical protein